MTVTVTVPTSMSSDGTVHIYTDDSDPNTGLDGGGHVARLLPLILDTVSVANYAVSVANSILGGATTNSTSTTSLTIGTGSKSLTLTESSKAYIIGQYVIIASTANPANYMTGQVTSFSGTSLVVNVTAIGGSGTIADWSISVTAIVNTSLNADNITSGTVNDARLPTAMSTKTITGLKLTKTAPTIATGVVTLDLSASNFFAISLTANITSFTLTNIPTTGTLEEYVIELTADGTARTVTWVFNGVTVNWANNNNVAPTLTSTNGKKDIFVFYFHNGATSITAFKAGQNA